MYSLFIDKNDEFSCKISIEGADAKSASPRLFLQTNQWGLVFEGKIENGRCIIPLKKLKSILNEGEKGTIKLEVVADDSLIVPWESEFEAKVSKKVTINEISNTGARKNNNPQITVSSVKESSKKSFVDILKEHKINIRNISKNPKVVNKCFKQYLDTLDKREIKYLSENKSHLIKNILTKLNK